MSASESNAVDWRPDVAGIAGEFFPVLDELEESRLQALRSRRNAMFAALGTVVLGLAPAFGLLAGGKEPVWLVVVLGATAIAAPVVYHAVHRGRCGDYRKHFKERVFRPAARRVAPGMDYLPQAVVPQASFVRGGLFDSRIDRYGGEDCFRGKVGSTDLMFSELLVERKETRKDSKGRTRTEWVKVFEGIYLIADFHKHFRGWVILEPDVAEAAFGWLGRKVQGLSKGLVRLENPEFERAFKVRASDPVEARYLLTPDMQERFLQLRRRWPDGIRACLVDSSLHLAIAKRENWFETDIRKPASDVRVLEDFLRQMMLLCHITEQLDLNTRIWTKE